MLSPSILTVAALVALACARPLPLNINLGAYSPALVVGDGAMSFEEANAVNNLTNTLQGAAVKGAAAAVANGAAEPAAAGIAAGGSTTAVLSQKGTILNEQAFLPVPGQVGPREETAEEPKVSKRQSAGFDRALTYAEAALIKGPKIQLGTPASGVGIIVDNNQAVASKAGTGIVSE